MDYSRLMGGAQRFRKEPRTKSTGFFSTGRGLRNWILSLNEPNEDHDDRNHQKYVDESPNSVGSHKTKDPKNEKHNGDGI